MKKPKSLRHRIILLARKAGGFLFLGMLVLGILTKVSDVFRPEYAVTCFLGSMISFALMFIPEGFSRAHIGQCVFFASFLMVGLGMSAMFMGAVMALPKQSGVFTYGGLVAFVGIAGMIGYAIADSAEKK